MFAIKKLMTNKNFSAEKKGKESGKQSKEKKERVSHQFYYWAKRAKWHTLPDSVGHSTRRDFFSLSLDLFVIFVFVYVGVCVWMSVCAPALFCVFLFSSKLPFIRFEVPLILGSIWLRILRFRICVSKNKPKVKFMTMCATPLPSHSLWHNSCKDFNDFLIIFYCQHFVKFFFCAQSLWDSNFQRADSQVAL